MRYRNSNQEHIDHLTILRNRCFHHESSMGVGIHPMRLFVRRDLVGAGIVSYTGPSMSNILE